MSDSLNIVIAQDNFHVGAIRQNTQKIIDIANNAGSADIVVFPELALTGYPPEDLLFRSDFIQRVERAIDEIQEANLSMFLVVGHPWKVSSGLLNAVSVIHNGAIVARYFKHKLPNHGVFDELRYFVSADQVDIEHDWYFECKGKRVGLLICEDLWHPSPIQKLAKQNVDAVIAPNASPFHRQKLEERIAIVKERAIETQLPILYVNHVCGQDELVFDGGSFAVNASGEVSCQLPLFKVSNSSLTLNNSGFKGLCCDTANEPDVAHVYQALVLAVRDYITKNGFKGAALGLSGGIDSAVTLAIAVDAIGADKVQAVMMPFRYTSSMSVEDAKEQAEMAGVKFDILPIENVYEQFMGGLAPLFEGTEKDTTEENLQARARGVFLMAISNKTGRILLTTGNKSENAVGYCTLYGDMCGGFGVIKDVPKMLVYALANYRNSLSPAIPQRVIDRPPSAELAPDQVDQDSLPPYEELDEIVDRYIECDESIPEIVAAGFDESIVRRVIRLIDINEYKRRQSAIGPKVTGRNFGKDRRYPITSGFGREA